MTDKLEAISQSITQNHEHLNKNGMVIDTNVNELLSSSPEKHNNYKQFESAQINDTNVHMTGMQNTTATNKSDMGSDLTLNKQINEVKPNVLINNIKLANLEEDKNSSNDENDELAGQSTDRYIADGTKSPRSKKAKKKMTFRSASKAVKQSIFKETESTKVKKMEKFDLNQNESQRWNRALQPSNNSSMLKIKPAGVQMKQSPSQMRMIGSKNQNHSSLHVSLTTEKQKVSGLRLGSQLRPGGSKLLVDKNQRGSNMRVSDHDVTLKGINKQKPEPPKLDPKEQAKHDEYWRFRLEPKEENSDADPDEYVCYSRLMRKLNNIKLKAPDEYSEDALNNSYNIDVSSVSSVEPEDEDPAEEDTEQSPAKPVKKKKQKKPKKKSVQQMMAAMFGKPKTGSPAKVKKARKPVINVYCTDYEVVKKAAKVYANFRLKERREDHDGAIVKGQGGQKLAEDWDVSWHDLGITADFFSKMQPYQKVSQFPGIYSICRKNLLARNLMKMKKAFPEKFKFFPRTYILPGEASEFRNQFTDRNGRPINRRKTYIVKPDNLAQGRGIYLSRNCEKVIESCTNEGGGWVVQEYLASPHLIEDLKYDLRIYVLLYGLNPLRIYIHEQGLARFATEPYEKPRPANLDNMFVHLTNYAINKMNTNFKQNNKKAKAENDDYGDYGDEDSDDYGDEEEEGHKRSLFAILKILYSQGADPDKVMAEIKDIVIKTIISGQPYMNHTYRVCQPECVDNSMCFQVLGFDIMIDKNFRPWLIEVNQSPSFATDSPLDYEVKKGVLKDTFNLLNVSVERREKYIRDRAEQAAERMLKGKTIKLGNEERETRKQEALNERFIFERQQINEHNSGFELVYPPLGDDELEAEYESMIQKAQDIWDEFTTGKGKKRMDEAKAAEQAKLDKRKSQIAVAGQGTPGGSHAPEVSDSDSSKSSGRKEEEIVAGTEELLACNAESQQSEDEKDQKRTEEPQQAGLDPKELIIDAEESQGHEINVKVREGEVESHNRPDEQIFVNEVQPNQKKPVIEIDPSSSRQQKSTQKQNAVIEPARREAPARQQTESVRQPKRQSPTLEQLCDRLELEAPQRLQGLEHLHNLAEAHQATDKIMKAAQKQQLEQLQGRDSSFLGGKKSSKFGDMIQMIKMAQANESSTNQVQNNQAHGQKANTHTSAVNSSTPQKSYQHLVSAPKGTTNLLGVSPAKISKKQTAQPNQNQTLAGFGKGAQYHQVPPSNQALLLTAIRGDNSQERKQFFNNAATLQVAHPTSIPLHALQSGSNFTSLHPTEESERSMRPEETPLAARRKGYGPGGAHSGAPTPQKSGKHNSGFDAVASAAYSHTGNMFETNAHTNSNFHANFVNSVDHSKRASPTVGMNIKTFSGSQASAMDQFTMARLQGLQINSKQQQISQQINSKQQQISQNNGQIFLQGHRKIQHQQDNQQAHKRGSPALNRDHIQSQNQVNDDRFRSRKISTQPGSQNQIASSQYNDKYEDKSIIIRPDKIHFQDQSNNQEHFQQTNSQQRVASKYQKDNSQKVKLQSKSEVPVSHYQHVKDLESWQGQQSIDREYLNRAQNIKLLKADAKASPLYSTKGLEHIGTTADGQNHYNYKLTLFNKAGQQTVKGVRENGPYEQLNPTQTQNQTQNNQQQSKTNSTAHSDRFRIAALRDSRRGSLYANPGQPSTHVPFALGSSFQAAGQQALFGNLGSSQLPQQRGETLPLHRHSIGPGVIAGQNHPTTDSPPHLDNDGNAFFPGGESGSKNMLLQAQFATPQQRASEKLDGPTPFAIAGSGGQQSPVHPSSIKGPYEQAIPFQSADKAAMLRNPSASRKQLLVPVLSSQSTQYAHQPTDQSVSIPLVNGQDSMTQLEHPGFRKQKQVSNAILMQANQIIQQVTKNGSQHHDLTLSTNGQAVLGGSRRTPLAEAISPSFPVLTETLSPTRAYASANDRSLAQIGASYDQTQSSHQMMGENSAQRLQKPQLLTNNGNSPVGASIRLHDRSQRSPTHAINQAIDPSPKGAVGTRGPTQYDAYQMLNKEDRENAVMNILGSNQQSNLGQHPNQAARRQLINKHTNINFANF